MRILRTSLVGLCLTVATPGFAAGGKDALFIVWDEQTGSTGTAPMPLIIVSPLGKVTSGGTKTSKAYNHEALLATFEETFGLARLNNAATVPNPINDIWK